VPTKCEKGVGGDEDEEEEKEEEGDNSYCLVVGVLNQEGEEGGVGGS
jgi:hypothetical protein